MPDQQLEEPITMGTVDETPIAPAKEKGRKNSLETHLKNRPERSELVDRNILPNSTAAPAIQGQQKELEKAMLEDKLNNKLSRRPTAEQMIKEGILHEDPRTADEKYEEAIEDEYAKREGGA